MQKRSNRLALRVLSTAALMAMVSSIATAAFADTYDLTKGSVTVNAKSDGTYVTQKAADGSFCTNESGKTLDNYKDETPVTLTTEGKEEKNNTASIYTEKGVSTTVTLDNVNIDASDTGKAAIYTEGKVTLELDGNNTLTGGEGHAALEKISNAKNNVPDENYTLTLQDETTGDGKTGSLTATGGAGGAGIGGAVQTAGGYVSNITITGGTITATGGTGAAGIGGGEGDSSYFSGNKDGGNAAYITISGENTTVTATGNAGGAGIGGGKGDDGYRSGQGAVITINGGAHVEATGGAGGAAIGGGDGSAGGHASGLGRDITITGEGTTVTATGGTAGSGIGGGQNSQGYIVDISGGAHVDATGGAEGGAGIGGGKKTGTGPYDGTGSTITISDKETSVTATGNGGGAGIGGGKGNWGQSITISGGEVTATGGGGGAGIGTGDVTAADQTNLPRAAAIQISGGVVTANGGAEGGAGIGGGKGTAASLKNGGNGVTITDGTVTATGGKGAAGIGSGAGSVWALGSFVDITGGTVTANGGAGEAAGIGNGENDANDAAVNISATTARLDVTAVTQGSDEAITGGDDMTMAELNNQFSGVVRFFRGTNHYNTVHNGKYVGMADNNANEHQETDAHIWGSTEIIRQATPTEQGIVRHHCAVDGCKGYYEEFFDYAAPAEPVTPAPTDPDTPNVPGTSDSTPGTPAQGTPADAATADAVPGAATAEEVSVTPSGAQTVTAAALPKTGVNWLAAVGSAISGMVLLAAGYVLDRKSRRQN